MKGIKKGSRQDKGHDKSECPQHLESELWGGEVEIVVVQEPRGTTKVVTGAWSPERE